MSTSEALRLFKVASDQGHSRSLQLMDEINCKLESAVAINEHSHALDTLRAAEWRQIDPAELIEAYTCFERASEAGDDTLKSPPAGQ